MQVRVLLIVSDPTVRKHLATLLNHTQRYSCCSAPSLAAGMDELRQQPYSLVILDLDLLGDDPAAAACQLRGANPAVRLIGLDSVAEERRSHESRPALDAVIPKPFFLEPLLAALPVLLPAGASGPEG